MIIDHELKQRLVGAAVITAISAIFVPMLFDDPVVDRSQAINELAVPEPPVVSPPQNVQTTHQGADNSSQADTSEMAPFPSGTMAPPEESEDVGAINSEMTPQEIEAEAAADRLATERLAKELGETELKPKTTPTAQNEKNDEKKLASKLKEKTQEQTEKVLPVKKLPLNKAVEASTVDKKPPVTIIDKKLVVVPVEKKPLKKIGAEPVVDQQNEPEVIVEKKPTKSAQDASLENQIAQLKKAKEVAIAEKKNAEKVAMELLVISEKKAKEKAAEDKLAEEKLIERQAEEYRKLVEKKAKEKALLDKKVAEKSAIDEKAAAKQQALDDKAALAKVAEDKRATEKASEDQKMTDQPTPARWFIRMGSFGQEANALALRDKLRKQGYPAVVDVIKTADKGNLYRLRVGPDLNKERAEKNRQKLNAENNASSILELD